MYVMHLWDMHNRTTEEQARKNRGRINDGKISKVENTTQTNDGGNDLDVHGDTVVVPKPAPRGDDNTGRLVDGNRHRRNDRGFRRLAGA